MSRRFDPFDRLRPPWQDSDPASPLTRPDLPGLPGQRYMPPGAIPGRPGGTARYFDPQPLPFDPTNPLNRFGLPGRNLGPAVPRPGLPNLQPPPPVKLDPLVLPMKPPQFDIMPSFTPGGTLPGLEGSAASGDSHSFDPSWWPWVFGGAAVVFLVSLLAGYASGPRPA